jgi:archaellum component FlaC
MMVFVSAVAQDYGLTKEEIKRELGRDIDKITDDINTVTTEISSSHIAAQKTGDAIKVSPETLILIEDVKQNIENLEAIMSGIEDGSIRLEEVQNG